MNNELETLAAHIAQLENKKAELLAALSVLRTQIKSIENQISESKLEMDSIIYHDSEQEKQLHQWYMTQPIPQPSCETR